MTHGEGTTVSPYKFFGFSKSDIQESLSEWKTGNLILSKFIYGDGDTVDLHVNRKHITKMIEEIGDIENTLNNIQESGDTDTIQCPSDIASCHHNSDAGLASPSFLSAGKTAQLETSSHLMNLSSGKASPLNRETSVLSHACETVGIADKSQSTSAHGERGPSPLLFTPVKGEDTHGAGFLSQRTNYQITPTAAGKVSSTPENLPPRFCTPLPKLINKPTTEQNGSGSHVSVGKKRSNECCSIDSPGKSRNISGASPELKVKHSRSECIISSKKPCVPGSLTPQNLPYNKSDLLVSPSPSKSSGTDLKVTAAQIDSSPSPSECNDTSFFITPKKEEEIPVMPDQLKLPYHNTQIRTKRKHRLRTLVSRARHSLSGIPPPPSLTIPQITIDEMLLKLKSRTVFSGFREQADDALFPSVSDTKNFPTTVSLLDTMKNMLQCNLESGVVSSTMDDIENASQCAESLGGSGISLGREPELVSSPMLPQQKLSDGKTTESQSLFHPSATEKEIIEMSWPTVLDCVHPGICYNLGTSSEALEELCQQVREKYVGNETASSCTIWSVSNVSRRSSPRQRKNSNSQANPQVREGYMMRRRRAFSVASLSSSIPSMATKSRQILIDKMTKLLESKKPKKIKEDKVSLMSKEAPKISLLKKFSEDRDGNSSKLKRSYSFNDSSSSGAQLSFPSSSEVSFSYQSTSKLMSTKRVLEFDRLPRASSASSLDCSTSQSELSSSLSSQKSCDNINSLLNNTTNHLKNQTSHSVGNASKDLSEVYKKKLLWAVAEALRSRGLGTGHDKFKLCAIPLFRCCRDAFIALPSASSSNSSMESSSERASDSKSNGSVDCQKERTSDKMLNIALQLVDQVMNEVGVEPVIKDKRTST